tara:strand:+ start:2645 stop:4261 length:1617 start_codon:yes stop_codon:yes gene_type:complete
MYWDIKSTFFLQVINDLKLPSYIIPENYNLTESGFESWNLGLIYNFSLTLLILITCIFSVYIVYNLLQDIKLRFISNFALPVIGIPIIFYYVIPTIFITLCSTNNFCFSSELERSLPDFYLKYFSGNIIEKFIFIKYYLFLIISIIGFYAGLRMFKYIYYEKPLLFYKFSKRINLDEIRLTNKLGKGIFYTYIIFSLILILFKLYTLTIKSNADFADLYYVANFTRIYSYYDFLLYPPAFLISIGSNKFKDSIYLSITILIKSFVMMFCLGRTFESFYLGSLGFFLLNNSYFYKNKNSLLNNLFTSKNKLLKLTFLGFISSFFFIFINKFNELILALDRRDFFTSLSVYKPLAIYQLFGNLVGTPQMIYKHFLNSELISKIDLNNYNILLSQFYKLIYPRYINTFLPDNFLLKYRLLSDYILDADIKEVGGTTFGSGFGLYSYIQPLMGIIFILLFSAINFYIFYFLTNKIQNKFENDKEDYSLRNYLYIFTALPFKSTWGGSLFPSEILWIYITYLLIKIYTKVLQDKNFLKKLFKN